MFAAPTLCSLPFQLPPDPWRDPQVSPPPHPIDFTAEVLRQLGGMNHQQGFVVGVGGRGRPIEGSSDHFAVIDHGELVVEFVSAGEA